RRGRAVVSRRLAVAVALGLASLATPAHADSVTPDQVHVWIEAYAAKYASAAYGFDDLDADAERVARCESIQFDAAVINGLRLGGLGEVGALQFLPGPRSIFWVTPTAAAGWDYIDAEANVAAAVYLISRAYGPRH